MKITYIPLNASEKELVQAALLSCVSDFSPDSEAIFQKSVEITGSVTLPRNCSLVYPQSQNDDAAEVSIPGLRTDFSALSGVDLKDRKLRKGAPLPIERWRKSAGAESYSQELTLKIIQEIEHRGNRAVVIADQAKDLGVIELCELV